MRIGIDARALASRHFTGIGYYLLNIIKCLEKENSNHKFFLYSDNDFKLPFTNSAWEKRIEKGFWAGMSTFWMLTKGSAMVMQDRVDVFWAPWPMIPFYLPIKKALTVHDFAWKRYPQTVDIGLLVLHHVMTNISIVHADAIFVISKSTLKDVDSLKPKTKQIFLTYNGVDASFKPFDRADSSNYISGKYNCSKEYILNVGTVEPRKNIINLMRAFKELKKKHKVPHQLLIAGAKGWRDSAILNEYNSLGEFKNDVIFLGYIIDEDLPRLYSGAEIFVFPSIYEGFGLPVLEAMACGCPVVASQTSSMPEVMGDCGLLVDPYQVSDITQKMYDLLFDEKLKAIFRQKGIERSKMFSWQTTANQILATLQGVK